MLPIWQCRKTGDCCKRFISNGPPVEKLESEEIIKSLDDEQIKKHLDRIGISKQTILENIHAKNALPLSKDTFTCAFLNENNECVIHNIKPKRCQTYPLIINEYSDKILISVDSACPRGEGLLEEIKNNRIPPSFTSMWLKTTKPVETSITDFYEELICQKRGEEF